MMVGSELASMWEEGVVIKFVELRPHFDGRLRKTTKTQNSLYAGRDDTQINTRLMMIVLSFKIVLYSHCLGETGEDHDTAM
jgi:hypothetical protein